MKIHEKIHFIRQQKRWSQGDMANKLGLSVNGYANIEQGKTDIQMSRLEQIAEVFELDLFELLTFGEKTILWFNGNNSPIGDFSQAGSQINVQGVSKANEKIFFELQRANLIIEQRDKEVEYLKQQIADLREMMRLLKEKNKC